MSSLRRRQLRIEDADPVAQLFVDAFGDARRMDGDEIREWFDNKALKRENLIVLEDGDRIAGYFDVWHEGDSADIDLAAPGNWAEGIDHAEERVRELGAPKARLFCVDGHELGSLAAERGYEVVRSSWTMEIELGVEAPREPVVPDGIELRRYRHPDDEQQVYEAMMEAFADHWGFHRIPIEGWRGFNTENRFFDPDLWLVALDGDELAGASLNYPDRGDGSGAGWIGTLGVRREWRKRGLGEALLRRSFALLHARGLRTIRLGVDAENTTGATRLYERVGMHSIRRSNTWERAL